SPFRHSPYRPWNLTRGGVTVGLIGIHGSEMMVMGTIVAIILLVLVIGLAIFAVARSVRIVPQARAGIVERFGRYHRTLHAGLNVMMPFIDRLRPLIDLREQVVRFPPH